MLPLYTRIATDNYSAKINAGRGIFGVGIILLVLHCVVMGIEVVLTVLAFKKHMAYSQIQSTDIADKSEDKSIDPAKHLNT
mmetsp:Transcript_6102/g.5501  ORF Transcript_6102/g.5501 Transcript_6102/m.5501 type:complete len:81 (-) Transcript_6102:603-845(-)